MLGVGGAKVLAALDISPGVLHLNEGHSAFAALELIRRRMTAEGIDVAEASRRIAAHIVFTTHTPVPAGHDRFPAALVEEHLGPLGDALGLSHDDMMAFGRVNPDDGRGVLHDGAGAENLPARQRSVVAARARLARDIPAAGGTSSDVSRV